MRIRERTVLWLYLGATNVLIPLGILLGLPFLLLNEKRRKTLFRRLGFQRYPAALRRRRPLWIHALSLGEALSCVLLVKQLRRRLGGHPICFSVSTLSAMQIAHDRILPHVDGLFYFPLDLWWPVRRALRNVTPELIVFIETDVWPGFQRQLCRTNTPALLVNGRLSPDSYRACRRFTSLFSPALNSFRTIFPQSTTEARRYLEVGVSDQRIGLSGNLKFDVANCDPPEDMLDSLREQLSLKSSDMVLLAGSTHSGEETAVIDAFIQVRKQFPNARLIIVPRHPARAEEVCALFEHVPLHLQLFSKVEGQKIWDVLIVDAMGVLSHLYHLASVSFVGGSLVAKGGQNPLESAAAACPVMFGPDMSDFPDIASWMLEAGAGWQIANSDELGEIWLRVLSEEETMKRMKMACREIIREHGGTTALLVEEIGALFERLRAEKSA